MMNDSESTKKYWESNICNWGDYYLEISHSGEEFNRPSWFKAIYRSIIMPIEARLMKKRYKLTIDFIHQYIKPDMVAVDVGCGTGVFVVEMLKQGAKVRAVDFTQYALDITKESVERNVPQYANNVEYFLIDVSKERLPESDIALAMGVTPYIEDLAAFFDNVLPTTKMLFCLIIDPMHWANIIRRITPFINVRSLHWFRRSYVNGFYKKHNWKLLDRKNFASGYLDLAVCVEY